MSHNVVVGGQPQEARTTWAAISRFFNPSISLSNGVHFLELALLAQGPGRAPPLLGSAFPRHPSPQDRTKSEAPPFVLSKPAIKGTAGGPPSTFRRVPFRCGRMPTPN